MSLRWFGQTLWLGKYIENFRVAQLVLSPPVHQKLVTSKIYYTPKVQKFPFTSELGKILRLYQRKDTVKPMDMKHLVECIISEYGVVHDLEDHPAFKDNLHFSVVRDYYMKPNDFFRYDGTIDYILHLNDTHFVPIVFANERINPLGGFLVANHNMQMKNKICRAKNLPERYSGYCLYTTGHEWQLFKIYNDFTGEKTWVFEGRNAHKTLYHDFEMVEVVLGLIDLCLETQREEVQVLNYTYDYLDIRKNMLVAATPEEAKINSPAGKLLTQFYEWRERTKSK